ncbi:hypothetical protein METP2_03142 [Methanosarcinales archaeon]|nr:hypothetical protein METP2_03142 [Methanosarcinales archaeon]
MKAKEVLNLLRITIYSPMNIKIVICFIIIGFLPAASLGATEKVWSAKSSGFIKIDESMAFENYLVKVTSLNNTNSTIIVYKDRGLIETKEFQVNEFKKYDDAGITLLGIIGGESWIAFSRLENKDIWIPSGRTILKWGDTYSFEDYSIEIEAIGKDSVNLTVSNSNKKTVSTDVFTKNGSKNYDNLRIVVMNINRTGFIEFEFFKYKIPTIKVKIITDKDEYFSDENISVLINITTDETLNIAGLSLDSKNPITFNPDLFTGVNINGTKSFKSQINKLPPDSTLTINAKVEGRDYFNNAYISTESKEVSVAPYVSIIKRVPEETDDEKVLVELLVYNSGSNRTFVHIHDNVTEDTLENQRDWHIEVGPKKSANVSYYIAPAKPGVYQLTSATVQWDKKKSTSKNVKMTVHMPYINLVKKALNNEGLTDVELEIINSGDRPAIVTVDDKIPDGFPLEVGSATWSGFVDAGKSANFKYSLKGNAVSLPEAFATYRDIRGTIRQVQSNAIQNNEIPGSTKAGNADTTHINAGRYEMIAFMILSFLVISGIIGSIAFTAYLITKIKTRSN